MRKLRFIVDVNLPKYFSFFHSDNFIFAADIGNITLDGLHKYFRSNWNTINQALENNFLIVANKSSIDILI